MPTVIDSCTIRMPYTLRMKAMRIVFSEKPKLGSEKSSSVAALSLEYMAGLGAGYCCGGGAP